MALLGDTVCAWCGKTLDKHDFPRTPCRGMWHLDFIPDPPATPGEDRLFGIDVSVGESGHLGQGLDSLQFAPEIGNLAYDEACSLRAKVIVVVGEPDDS